jgi:hypothetical protein
MLIGFQSDIQISIDGGNTYATMGQIPKFGLPGSKINGVEKSYSTQPDFWLRRRPGMSDPGTLKQTFIFTEQALNNLLGLWYGVEDSKFLYYFPKPPGAVSHGTILSFLGYVDELLGDPVDIKEGILQSFNIQVSGPWAVTAAA